MHDVNRLAAASTLGCDNRLTNGVTFTENERGETSSMLDMQQGGNQVTRTWTVEMTRNPAVHEEQVNASIKRQLSHTIFSKSVY